VCTFYSNIYFPFDLGPVCSFAHSYHQVLTLHPPRSAVFSENDLLGHPLRDQVHDLNARVITVEDGLQRLQDHNEMWRARNFASKGEGAEIIQALTSETHGIPRETIYSWFLRKVRGFDMNTVHINPPSVVMEKTFELGECWEFTGPSGHIGISFSRPIKIANVTIHQAHGIVSAKEHARVPRDLVLWGQVDISANTTNIILENRTRDDFFRTGIRGSQSGTLWRLAEMQYAQVSKAQTFKLSQAAENVDASFEAIIVEVLSNWGAPTTCLYHISVHGVEPAEGL
jgi:hypothetical protein